MPARTIRNVLFKHLGQTYSGSYEVVDGVISVASAYGSKKAVIGGSRPNVVAADLMAKIVREYRR